MSALPQYYHSTTTVLTQYYHSTTTVFPQYYHTTGLVDGDSVDDRQHCVSTPTVVLLVQYCHSTATVPTTVPPQYPPRPRLVGWCPAPILILQPRSRRRGRPWRRRGPALARVRKALRRAPAPGLNQKPEQPRSRGVQVQGRRKTDPPATDQMLGQMVPRRICAGLRAPRVGWRGGGVAGTG